MKSFWQLLFLCFVAIPVLGQNITVTGVLVESDMTTPVEQATIRLLSLPDSTLVMGTTTNDDGKFTLRGVAKGNYLVFASYVGYHNLYKALSLTGNKTTEDLGKLPFQSDDILLKEAVVVGKAIEITVKKDTIEYNAASYKTEENAVIEDLLKKLPGVEVDNEGKITVGGKEITKILVDGKDFFTDDPKVASKNLPVNMIEKLQVLDQLSDASKLTGFDDGNEETVINLTIKPGMKKSTVGNASASLGRDMSSNGDMRYEVAGMVKQMNDNDSYTLMFNGNNTNNMGASDMGGNRFGGMRGMRRGGNSGINTSEMLAFNMNKEFSETLTLNGDINYNGSDRISEREVNRVTDYKNKGENEMQSLIEKTQSRVNDISDNVGVNLKLEWKPDENNTLIFRPNFSHNKSQSTERQDYLSLNGNTGDTISYGPSNSRNMGSGYNVGGRLEYAHQFSKVGRIFSVSLRGNHNSSNSQELYDWTRYYYTDGIYSTDSVVRQQSENDHRANTYMASTSYVEPLGNNYFLQLAYRIEHSETKSTNSTYDLFPEQPELYPFLQPDTATIRANQSRSTIRNSVEQRYSLNFKSIREKYNYTIGLNVDPTNSNNKTVQPHASAITTEYPPLGFDGRLPNVMGDSIISEIAQDVLNFSPTVNFRYNFGDRTNLRVDYSGNTTQPSANQLRDYTDYSNPQNAVTGNPNLKPGYNNRLSARFENFISSRQLFYNFGLRGNLSMNDISSVVKIDPVTRNRETTYENINGNWDINGMGMFNMPLNNKRFSINNFLMASFRNQRGYTNELLNTMKSFTIRERAGVNYRSDLFDAGLNANVSYVNTINDVNPGRNLRTYDYGMMVTTTWYLPRNFTINSDISWNDKQGYSDGFNQSETIWNASVTKPIPIRIPGTISMRLKIFDILQDRKSISRSVGDNYVQDTRSNILQSFFLFSFIYKFNILPGGSSGNRENTDSSRENSQRREGGRSF